jgi:hypothetical protein
VARFLRRVTKLQGNVMIAPKTFLQAAEIWLPAPDQWLLEFGGGAYGPAKSFAELSHALCFGRAEGLPGQAWDEGRPVLLRQFEKTSFRRINSAQAAGFTCAVAVPFFNKEKITAVLVLFCGHADEQVGALELWHAGAGTSANLTLVDGAYGPSAPAFESVSRRSSFARGVGLPGLAWFQGSAQILQNLTQSANFVRRESAASIGLAHGLAIPLSTPGADSYVISFLGSAALPLARRIERWTPDDAQTELRCVRSYSATRSGPLLSEAARPIEQPQSPLNALVAGAWLSGIPAITQVDANEAEPAATAPSSSAISALLAIPVERAGAVAEVLVLSF